ncbi:MAG TPA: glycosyltransferase [Xanthobacteraceae bacterium]|jgi:cellulose synthase/poly-beta-1,6-N-acetylglucosamine synthase-like glycosyltransferase/exo-beta-1,3-glucanase (GH17 family)
MRWVVAVVALVACVHAGLWAYLRGTGTPPPIDAFASVSYSPFEGTRDNADSAPIPTAAQVRADLTAIRLFASAIRTYRSTRGMEIVPAIASELDMRMMLGIYLDTNLDRDGNYDLVSDPDSPDKRISRNELEIRTGLKLAHRYGGTVKSVVVGNETTLRRSMVAAAEADEAYAAFVNPGSHENPVTHQKMTYPDFRTAFAAIKAEWDTELRDEAAQQHHLVKDSKGAWVGDIKTEWIEDIKAEWNVDELTKVIQRVRRQVPPDIRVTTGETWDIWVKYPKLANPVDFVGAHILPYWDKASAADAVDHTLDVYYGKLQQALPGKPIVVAEFGWPSAGYNRGAAEPGQLAQATVLRSFVTQAKRLGIDYNVIEAYDQPWKSFEGSVGAYWGILDTSRHAKFSLDGVIGIANYWKIAALAVAVGFLVSLPILGIAGATRRQSIMLAVASHAVGAWTATVFSYWTGHYFVIGAGIALAFGLVLLIPLVVIALARVQEIAAVLFGPAPARLLASLTPAASTAVPASAAPSPQRPKVSIHIPAYMEPPEMLRQTLDAVARLAYPDFECIVVINNTPDPAYWQPIEKYCAALGPRFKFINAERVAGFKAGALRLALDRTAPDAEVIGILDADYVVHPDWLKDVMPAFADPNVGLIQAPQDHRDETTPLHWAMNGEYAGFFDIGMVQRNEHNAIIVHGTMCLIRRAALDAAGGWSSDTICEDTDLGLTIIERGWRTLYTRRRYGHGLLPDTFEAFKKQRHRWAYGGLQIVRKHWRRFLPGASLLTRDQKREFTLGWLNWLGAESVGVAVALLNLIWVPIVAFAGIAIPDKILTLPIIATFAVSVAHFVTLYRRRVAISPGQMAAAMFAAMAMQWTVARAVVYGLVTEHLPFVRTAKGGHARKKRVTFPAFHEALMGALLIAGAVTVLVTNDEHVREINLFADVLIVQSLPFLAAAALALVEETRLNDFAFWRNVEVRLGAALTPLLPRRAAPTAITRAAKSQADAA